MVIPYYLAVTQAEISRGYLPAAMGYLGCHFSESGIAGLPAALPPKALLILDDRVPMGSQEPAGILKQLRAAVRALDCAGLLLDFQQTDSQPQKALAHLLAEGLEIPVAAPPFYASDRMPIFLPPIPPDTAVSDALLPWAGRKIWLDAPPDGVRLTLTRQGCTRTPLPPPQPPGGFWDAGLCCRYTIEPRSDGFRFLLSRDKACISAMLDRAAELGVELAVGLWQEYFHFSCNFGCKPV